MEMNYTVPAEARGQRLSGYLASIHAPLRADCGGRGVCGKCAVTLLHGSVSADAEGKVPLLPDKNGKILACRAFICGEAEVLLPDTDGEGLTAFAADGKKDLPETEKTAETGKTGYGVALDIGTTTLAASLVDRSSGRVLASVSRLNPQRSFGADVMSRITASEHALTDMKEAVIHAARAMTEQLREKIPGAVPETMTAVGNPTMLHLFCGEDPRGMGAYPFTPVFTEKRTYTGEALGLPFGEVVLLPSASAFIGSDITAGAAAAFDMGTAAAPVLFIDIGTNGEILLYTGTDRGGRLYGASAAAGPAMEGAGISCGVGGIPGAVCAVRWENGDRCPKIETVGNAAPVGVCGSGLIDLIAVLLDRGIIDETGYLDDDPFVFYEDPTVPGGAELSLTQEDIRQFQLAKSAIRAGIEALLAHAGLTAEDVGAVYIAGGLGFYMHTESAVRCGLLPELFADRTKAVGNTALAGAGRALCMDAFGEKVRHIAETCEVIELNASRVFNEAFIESMLFPEQD